MKTHTTIGGRILHGSVSGFLQMAEKIAMTHHERWDGNGYPKGIKGEEIPIEGRIMNIADQYNMMLCGAEDPINRHLTMKRPLK